MSRSFIAKKIISYLETKINCKSVSKFIENTPQKMINLGKNNIYYHLDIDEINDNQKKDLHKVYDFITNANYSGFEFFPYLYGILECPIEQKKKDKIYVFYEHFDGNILNLINNIGHQSEWYDIVFQFAITNHYIFNINNYCYYGCELSDNLYIKHAKPYYQEYQISGYKFTINHKYLIVLWNIKKLETVKNNNFESNIKLLLDFLIKNKDNIKIYPSNRVIDILKKIVEMPVDTIKILADNYIV